MLKPRRFCRYGAGLLGGEGGRRRTTVLDLLAERPATE